MMKIIKKNEKEHKKNIKQNNSKTVPLMPLYEQKKETKQSKQKKEKFDVNKELKKLSVNNKDYSSPMAMNLNKYSKRTTLKESVKKDLKDINNIIDTSAFDKNKRKDNKKSTKKESLNKVSSKANFNYDPRLAANSKYKDKENIKENLKEQRKETRLPLTSFGLGASKGVTDFINALTLQNRMNTETNTQGSYADPRQQMMTRFETDEQKKKRIEEQNKKIKENSKIYDALYNKYQNYHGDILNDNSISGKQNKVIADVMMNVGNQAPQMIGGALGPVGNVAGLTAILNSSIGSGYEQAINEGATDEKAKLYGLLSGLNEIGTEKMFSQLGGLKGGYLDNLGKSLVKNDLLRSIIGENIEEATNTTIDPFLKRLTYDKEAPKANKDDYLNTALITTLSSLLMGGTGKIGQNISEIKNADRTSKANQDINTIVNTTLNKDVLNDDKTNKGIFDKNIGTKNNYANKEQIDSYIDYALDYGREKRNNPDKNIPKQRESIIYGKTSDRLVNDIKSVFGIDLSNMEHILTDNDIRHINNSHGEYNSTEKYPVTADDLKQIPDIVENYDNVYYIKRKNGKEGIVYQKRHNGVTYYLEQIIGDTQLQNKQMIKTSTGTIPTIEGLKEAINKRNTYSPPDGNISTPRMYVQDARNSHVPNNNILQGAENINEQLTDTAVNENTKGTFDIVKETKKIREEQEAKKIKETENMMNVLSADNSITEGKITRTRDTNLNEETKKTINKILEKSKTKAVFESFAKKERNASGYYEDGVIHINKDMVNTGDTNAVMEVFKHELTHRLEEGNRYNVIQNQIFRSEAFQDYLKEKGTNLKTLREDTYLSYEKSGKILDRKGIDKEITANFVSEKLFTDEKAINKLVRENKTLGQKILNLITDIIDKIKLVGKKEDIQELRKIENMYRRSLERLGQNTNNGKTSLSIQRDKQFSIREINGKKGSYGKGVLLDTNLFENIHPRKWNKTLSKYVYDNMAGKELILYDENGNEETIYLARKNDRVKKDGAKNDHKVLDKLANSRNNNTKALAIVHLSELLETSKYENSNNEHSHQWLDENGWEFRKTYLQDMNGKIYEVTLNIANGRDRKILYEINKVNEIDKNSNKKMSLSKNTITDKNQHSRYQESRMGGSQSKTLDNSILENNNIVNNQGKPLSKAQQEYFKDSKVRDKDGNLLVMYHGTSESFTVFDKKKAKYSGLYGKGFYFTNSGNHAGQYGNQMEVYLNIKNPLSTDETTITKAELKKFLEEVKNNEDDYSFENYGYNATIDSVLNSVYGKSDFNMLYDINQTAIGDMVETVELFNKITGKKFDGFILPTETVVFNPNQIKNVNNENPTSSDDIRYSIPIKKESKFYSNSIINSKILDNTIKDMAENEERIRYYGPDTNKAQLERAKNNILNGGQEFIDNYLKKDSDSFTGEDIATGAILMKAYQDTGDYDNAIKVMEHLRKAGTNAGQTVQAISLVKRLTPEGMVYYANKSLQDALNKAKESGKVSEKWLKKHEDNFKLNEDDIENIDRRMRQIEDITDEREKDIILSEVFKIVDDKIPVEFKDKYKAYRRISMLFNPKTQGRNVLGNTVMIPIHTISDTISTQIDKVLSKKTGIRTTSYQNYKEMAKGAKQGLREAIEDYSLGVDTRNKGADRFEIDNNKRVFKNKTLNSIDRLNSFLLDAGDRPFYQAWYNNALHNLMKENNVTKPTKEMIEIAEQEALERTWQDKNKFTESVFTIRKTLNNITDKLSYKVIGHDAPVGLGDMIMAFTQTPANLAKAMIEYNPLSVLTIYGDVTNFNNKVKEGTVTIKDQKKLVNKIGKSVSGTIASLLFYALADAGIITGSNDDDKEVAYFEENFIGKKPFSIKIGDKYYTYDWMSPVASNMIFAAEMNKSFNSGEYGDLNNFEKGIRAVTEAINESGTILIEQSVLSGLNDFLKTALGSYNNGELDIMGAILDTVISEPSILVPSLVNQIGQYLDDTVRVSYDATSKLNTSVNKVKAKIPGLNKTLEPKIDVMGNEVKRDNTFFNVFLNPANTSKTNKTKSAEELYRLYKATGETGIIPKKAPYTIYKYGEKITLSPKDRTGYQKDTGKFIEEQVKILMGNSEYKKLSDSDKVEIVKNLNEYGTYKAKNKYANIPLSDYSKKIYNLESKGINPAQYFIINAKSDYDKNGNKNKYETKIAIAKSNMSSEEKQKYYSIVEEKNTSKYGNIFSDSKVEKGLKDISIQEIVKLRQQAIAKSKSGYITEKNLKEVLNKTDYAKTEKYAIFEILKNANFKNPY